MEALGPLCNHCHNFRAMNLIGLIRHEGNCLRKLNARLLKRDDRASGKAALGHEKYQVPKSTPKTIEKRASKEERKPLKQVQHNKRSRSNVVDKALDTDDKSTMKSATYGDLYKAHSNCIFKEDKDGDMLPTYDRYGYEKDWIHKDTPVPANAKGAPLHDLLGYRIDFKKLDRASRPFSKSSLGTQKYMDKMERENIEAKRKAEIMGTERSHTSAFSSMAWNDRVARDLGMDYHKVEMIHFEEWHARGFRVRSLEFDHGNITKEENDRILRLAVGSAFRE